MSAVPEKFRNIPFRRYRYNKNRRSAHKCRLSVSVDGFSSSNPNPQNAIHPESWAHAVRHRGNTLQADWPKPIAPSGMSRHWKRSHGQPASNSNTSSSVDAHQEQRVTCEEAGCITSPNVRYDTFLLQNGMWNVPTDDITPVAQINALSVQQIADRYRLLFSCGPLISTFLWQQSKNVRDSSDTFILTKTRGIQCCFPCSWFWIQILPRRPPLLVKNLFGFTHTLHIK
jgi:hypothetical protein